MNDLSKQPLLMQCYEVMQAIEACGASPQLTATVIKAGELLTAIDKHISAQPAPMPVAGQEISMDVSTGDDDAGNRIFAVLTGECGSDGTWLAEESCRNFSAQQVVAVPPEVLALTDEFIDRLIQRVCELPDRSSPEDDPEAMVCSPEELRNAIRVTEDEFRELGRAAIQSTAGGQDK